MKQTELIISSDPLDSESEDGADALAEVESRIGHVSADLHGSRLDRALVDIVPEFSRSYLQQLIEAGGVSVNSKQISKSAHKVKAGDAVSVELRPTPQSQAFKPEPISLTVLYEDDHILVINKPAGLVVHPAPGNWSGTILNGLLARYLASALVPRAGIVHRLDKDTSGLMVVARTRAAMDELVRAIANRTVSRQYLAIAHREWTQAARVEVDAPMGRDPRNRLRMAVVDLEKTAGKTARTDIELIDSVHDACLVRCILHTGRTHQIRVHMAHIGHPLIADTVYGGSTTHGMQRQALHAYHLAFEHPVTGQSLVFKADLPLDMINLVQNLALRYNQE